MHQYFATAELQYSKVPLILVIFSNLSQRKLAWKLLNPGIRVVVSSRFYTLSPCDASKSRFHVRARGRWQGLDACFQLFLGCAGLGTRVPRPNVRQLERCKRASIRDAAPRRAEPSRTSRRLVLFIFRGKRRAARGGSLQMTHVHTPLPVYLSPLFVPLRRTRWLRAPHSCGPIVRDNRFHPRKKGPDSATILVRPA